MSDDALCWLPATRLAAMIRAREVSPVELARAVLDRVAAVDTRVNAFATLDAEGAMRQARAAEAAVMRDAPLGALHGVTVTIKDLADTADLPTQSGSHIREGARPAADAPVVERLRSAGAVVLGKTTTSEFGWSGISRSPLTGATHNPWGHGLNAGASSAGAGAAAAAGYGPLHQGSDGAGSIRMPAHFCGVFGLKPSFGRVPYAPVPVGDYTSVNGPLTRTVADAALMLRVMAGADPRDHTTLGSPPDDYPALLQAGIAGKRIGFSADLGFARVDPEVAALVRGAAGQFAAACGAVLEDAATPWGPEGAELIRIFWPAHLTRLHKYLPAFRSRMDPGLVACIEAGAPTTMAAYQLARERKMAYVAAIHAWFADWDFLITPSASCAAFPVERLMPADWPDHAWDWVSWAEFLHPFNMAWNPAASVPCGCTAAGLPVGMQIVGRRFDDAGVLRASAAFERALPWAERRPAP